MSDSLIRELLLGDDVAGQVELLLNLLSDAAAGRELSNVVSEIIQVCNILHISNVNTLLSCVHRKEPSGVGWFGMDQQLVGVAAAPTPAAQGCPLCIHTCVV